MFLFAGLIMGSVAGAAVKKQKLGAQFPEGEKAIYMRLVDSYRRGSLVDTYRFRDLILKHYSASIYADNALYLAGLLDYQRGRTSEAIHNFGQIVKRYPQGNKRAAALYAKSMAYSKLNLHQLSRQLLEEITKTYPGSPESQRAWMDLRISEKRG